MTDAVQSNKPSTTRVMSAAKFERLSGSQASMSYFRFVDIALRSKHRGVCRRVRR